MAIEDVFPDQTNPDRNNSRADGSQFKAPDHLILDGRVLIERKSRNGKDDSKFYLKLQEIAAHQGKPFYAVGRLNLAHIIKALPDPDGASRKMADFMLNQTMKRLREANEKFVDYARNVGDREELRVVIVADNTSIMSSTALDEHFIGRKMGGYGNQEDITDLIDSIILVKNPEFVIDETNSYWFKSLLKRRVTGTNRDLALHFANALHDRIGHYAEFVPAISRTRHGRFRILTT